MGINELNKLIANHTFDNNNHNVSAIINVSDEPFHAFKQHVGFLEVPYFWYPILEHLYWDHAIMAAIAHTYWHFAEYRTEDIIFHCHAGINRSATMAYALKLHEHKGNSVKAIADIETYSDPIGWYDNNVKNAHLPIGVQGFFDDLWEAKEGPIKGVFD